MSTTSIRWGLALGTALLAQVSLIVISVLCVAVYSYAIHTGETQAFYNAFAMRSGPWISLIAGGPVFFLIARWIRRRAGAAAFSTAMAQLGLYFAIEATVFLLWSGEKPEIPAASWALVIAASLIKVAAAWIGAGGIATPPQAQTT
jgi:hypothetical protein